jgi:hypothetical protein
MNKPEKIFHAPSAMSEVPVEWNSWPFIGSERQFPDPFLIDQPA